MLSGQSNFVFFYLNLIKLANNQDRHKLSERAFVPATYILHHPRPDSRNWPSVVPTDHGWLPVCFHKRPFPFEIGSVLEKKTMLLDEQILLWNKIIFLGKRINMFMESYVGKFWGPDSIQSQISSKTSRGKRTAQNKTQSKTLLATAISNTGDTGKPNI